MSGDAKIQVCGNVAADPELRFTVSGLAVAGFTVCTSPRKKNAAGEWVDAESAFYRVTVWREVAEHVVDTIRKGQRVLVVGTLKPRQWERENADGTVSKGLSLDLDAEEVGPSLRWATATVRKATRAGSGEPNEDVWSQAIPAGNVDTRTGELVGAAAASADTPPF